MDYIIYIYNYLSNFLAQNEFWQFWIIITTTIVFVWIARILKQPSIVWYVLSWIVLWPEILNLINNQERLNFLWHFWITLLMFIVWLGLNPKLIKELSWVSFLTWISQIIFSLFIWYYIWLNFWLDQQSAFFIWLWLAFSSTIISLQLLYDNNEIGSLYWKIISWILIVQDVIAIIALMFVDISISSQSPLSIIEITQTLIIKWWILSVFFFFLSKFLLPQTTKKIAKNQEYLFIFAIWRCLFVWTIFSIFWFSTEVWALIAWLGLASSTYRHFITVKLKPLRDFFLALFFVLLGSQINFDIIKNNFYIIILLTIFVILIRTIFVISVMWSMYYKKKTSFFTAITISQISEFAAIITNLGIQNGKLNPNIFSIVSAVMILTMIISTYLFKYKEILYYYLKNILTFFERKHPNAETIHQKKMNKKGYEIILLWYWTVWQKISKLLMKQQKNFVVIDSNPDIIETLNNKWIPNIYWDIEDDDLLENSNINLNQTKIIIWTINDFEWNSIILQKFKNKKYKNISIILVSHNEEKTIKLYEMWADYVLMPHHIWAHHTVLLLEKYARDEITLIQEKIKHIEEIKKNKI